MENAHDAPHASLSLGTVEEPGTPEVHSRHDIQTGPRDGDRANANDAQDAPTPHLGRIPRKQPFLILWIAMAKFPWLLRFAIRLSLAPVSLFSRVCIW